jgi:hypothetical protein
MNIFLLIITVGVGVGLAAAEVDTSYIQTVCDQVRSVDSNIVKQIEALATVDRNDFLNNMREYVKAIRNFESCIEQDREATTNLAQDILEEEGPKFYYIYDPDHIQNTLNWSESDMDECNRLHKQAVDTWIEIDKKISGR